MNYPEEKEAPRIDRLQDRVDASELHIDPAWPGNSSFSSQGLFPISRFYFPKM
jgi:hypothetical protein